MFKASCNYPKLKTNLRLTINRLKLLEKKKTELALKARKEIADYIQAGKEDRARIRVEHIVREDYMVEAMEILEMFCDLLLARFGIIERVSAMDPTIEEAVASVIWAEPRLSTDIPEFSVISKNLMARYGKEYHAACRANTLNNVNDKLIHKMSIYSPPKMLIENYMVEIAKSFNVDFVPDPLVMLGEDGGMPVGDLLNLGQPKNPPPPPNIPPSGGGSYPPPSGGGYPPPSGGGGYPPPSGGGGGSYVPPGGYPPPGGLPAVNDPAYPPAGASAMSPTSPPFNYPSQNGHPVPTNPPNYTEKVKPESPLRYSSIGGHNDLNNGPGPSAGATAPSAQDDLPGLPEIPNDDFNLPSVPGSTNPGAAGGPSNSNDIDFDDLTARFENLKKRK